MLRPLSTWAPLLADAVMSSWAVDWRGLRGGSLWFPPSQIASSPSILVGGDPGAPDLKPGAQPRVWRELSCPDRWPRRKRCS